MKKIQEQVEIDNDFVKHFVMDAIKNPKKFYSLLVLSGMKSSDAYRIVYNLKYPRKMSANFETKMRMLHLLQNIVELITKDKMLYSRLRTLAVSGNLQHIGKNVAKQPYSKKNKSFDEVSEEGMSLGNSSLAGVTQDGQPEQNPPVSPIMMMIRRALQSRKTKKRNKFNPIIHQ
jgi:hypothetical protein